MIFALAITGPTASGKTALSLGVARALGCEIVSCDSMQIYRGMDVGTAKATAEEQSVVPHHLIDIVDPDEDFSAESYREAAMAAMRAITDRGRIPLLVGGTGLYVDTLMRVGADTPASDPEYRARLMQGADTEEGRIALWERLREVDPETAEAVHYNNVKRVVRALEIYDKTGRPKSVLDRESRECSPELSVGMITVDFHNRENIYARVDMRVDMMINEGLIDEVRALYERGYLRSGTASAAIGYKEVVRYLRGECTLGEAAEEIKLSSRRYAKRQLTWFRHEDGAYRIFADDENGKMKSAEELLSEAIGAAKEFITQYERQMI